jgi:uncharacterized protein
MASPKLDSLLDILKGMKTALLAYSGGLDSTFLLKALKLSGIRALAVTAQSEATPLRDLEDAVRMAREIGVGHRVISTAEMNNENYLRNPPDRCFYCKDELFGKLGGIAEEEGLAFVIDGSNRDDRDDYRPGMRAAREHGVRSPLDEAGFTKNEIREASRALVLPTWQKPASPCLSSRFPYGVRIIPEALKRVDLAEEFLRTLGLDKIRVRDHGGSARIEVPPEVMQKIIENKIKIIERFRSLGYDFVSLDLEGLRSGSLNRVLKDMTGDE